MSDDEIRKFFAEVAERLIAQLPPREPNFAEMLRNAQVLIRLGATRTQLQTVFTAKIGNKLWYIFTLNERFPKLTIVDRILLAPDRKDYINPYDLRLQDLSVLCERSSPEDLAKLNEKLQSRGEGPVKAVTEDEVAVYFAYLTGTWQRLSARTESPATRNGEKEMLETHEVWQYEYLQYLYPNMDISYKNDDQCDLLLKKIDFSTAKAKAFKRGWGRCTEYLDSRITDALSDAST